VKRTVLDRKEPSSGSSGPVRLETSLTSQLERQYRRDDSLVTREIAGGVILVPIRRHVGDLDSIYNLNKTAARAWELIDGQRTVAEIRDRIVAQFEVGPEEAQQDLLALLEQLEAIGAVERVGV
jgi:hypothetical protein